ncbi:hypothetical protein [Bradyrhizobium sp. USDA 377]
MVAIAEVVGTAVAAVVILICVRRRSASQRCRERYGRYHGEELLHLGAPCFLLHNLCAIDLE